MGNSERQSFKEIGKFLLYTVFPRLRGLPSKRRRRNFYNARSAEVKDDFLPFMNWGYAPLNKQEIMPQLSSEDELWRPSIQLYHHVVRGIKLDGMDILDIGCGRGGGSGYLWNYLNPKTLVGIDISSSNIELCSRKYSDNGLSFRQGDAEALPFEDDSFDGVVNVESSHDYPNLERFYQEVARVLRSGGYFFYTDYGSNLVMDKLKHTLLKQWDFKIIKAEDTTANVVEALREFSEQKKKLFRDAFPDDKQFQQYCEWARLKGTSGYNKFRDRMEVYNSFLLQKR